MGSDETGSCLLWKLLGAQKKMQIKSGVGGLNPSTREAKAGESLWVRGQPGLQSKFQDRVQSYRETLSRGEKKISNSGEWGWVHPAGQPTVHLVRACSHLCTRMLCSPVHPPVHCPSAHPSICLQASLDCCIFPITLAFCCFILIFFYWNERLPTIYFNHIFPSPKFFQVLPSSLHMIIAAL